MIKPLVATTLVNTLIWSRRFLTSPSRIIVIAPTSQGSLGDQAVMEVCRSQISDNLQNEAQFLYLDEWMPFRMRKDTDRTWIDTTSPNVSKIFIAKSCMSAQAIAMIGADVVDGVYNPRTVVARLDALALAGRAGLKIGVFGASISTQPSELVMATLARLPDLHFHARDPVSKERFERATGKPATLVADLAFLLTPELRAENARKAADWAREQRQQGRRVIAVNASSHTLTRVADGAQCYIGILRKWLTDYPDDVLLLVPHDFRPTPVGDVEPLDEIFQELSSSHPGRHHFVRPPFDAWDAKALCGYVDAVITGRMHFAIAALGMGIPPFCIVYQGKFEGLMRHFGLEGLTIAPEALHNLKEVVDLLAAMMVRNAALKAQIAARLPAVREFSKHNFQWLTQHPGD